MSCCFRIFFTTVFFIFYCSILKAQQVTDSLSHPNLADSLKTDTLHKNIDLDPATQIQAVDSTGTTSSEINDTSFTSKKKSYLMIGLSYINDNVYLGRKDSVRLPYITFNAGYYFKSGFFIDGSINYLASSDSRIDAVNFDAGYSFTANKYVGEATISKYFYSSKSTNVKSEVKSSLS